MNARLTVIVALLFTPALGMAQTWQDLGPAPIVNGQFTGRVSALACSPTDPNRYFAAGADGGVWRTVDGGASWTPLTDHMPTSAMGALALDPTDENTIYAGTGEANYANHSRYGLGIYKSTDGGDSWVQLAESVFGGRSFSRIVVNPQNPQIVYASITRAGGFPELAAAKGHPGATGPLGVFRSDDGGVNWVRLAASPDLSTTDLDIDPVNPDVLYAGVGRIYGHADNGVYKSTNGGAGWTRLGGGLPSGATVGRISVRVAPSDPNRVYALLTRPSTQFGGNASTLGAYRSDDAGASWTQIPVGSLQATYGWYLSVISVQPSDPDVVIMGGLNLRRSTNAGAGWSTVTPPHVDMHAVDWDASGRLIVGDDGGVHRSENLGASWTSLNNGLATIQFYAGLSTHPVDDLIVFGGLQDNGSVRRNTATRNWTHVYGGDGGWTQMDQVNPLRVFVEYQGTGNLFRSENGGNSFVGSSSGINRGDRNPFLPVHLIDPTDSTRMLYATHRVYRSVNSGVSWTPISGDLTTGSGAIRAMAIAPSDVNVVYAATNDGNVLISRNGGVDFDLLLSGVPGWPRVTREIFIDPTDALTMYLAVANFNQTQIRRTTDGGQTWQPLDANFPDVPVNVLAVDVRPATPVIYAGADNALYRSLDDGATWRRYGEGLPTAAVIDLRLDTQRGRLIAGTQGRGAWSVAVTVPGDFNFDQCVDLSDLGVLLADFGCTAGPGACPGDIDGDGDTDLADLGLILANFGLGCP